MFFKLAELARSNIQYFRMGIRAYKLILTAPWLVLAKLAKEIVLGTN